MDEQFMRDFGRGMFWTLFWWLFLPIILTACALLVFFFWPRNDSK